MGILKNCPFVLRDIMAFLVLEVLSGLEIDGVSQIFTLFKNVADGGRTPAVHIFESLVFVHALAVLGKVSGRDVYKRQVWARVRFYRGKEKLVKIIGGDNNA